MPIVGATGPFPLTARRVLVAGASGSGKSTLAHEIADTFGLPYVELDALYHGPEWQPRPSFVDDVTALAKRDEWVTEWQYPQARALLADRAELVVFLDLPRWLVTWRVVGRTVHRAIRRTELWNGNTEAPLRTIVSDRDHVVRWSIRTHPEQAPRIDKLAAARPELAIVWLRSRHDVKRWSAELQSVLARS